MRAEIDRDIPHDAYNLYFVILGEEARSLPDDQRRLVKQSMDMIIDRDEMIALLKICIGILEKRSDSSGGFDLDRMREEHKS